MRNFTIAALAVIMPATIANAADVTAYGIAKAQQFTQSVGGSPVILGTNGYSFQSFVIASTNGVLTNATVKPSNSTPLRQLTGDTNGVTWRFEESFNTQSALDSTYPGGSTTYTVKMQTVNDVTHSPALTFYLLPPFVSLTYPTTPAISNLTPAQSIDNTRDFVLQFGEMGGGLAVTIVQLIISDTASNVVYSTPGPFQAGALSGTSTNAVIPANALPPGAALTAHLTAANAGVPDTNTYSGAIGIATLAKDTQFPLSTRPAPPVPILEMASMTPVQLLATQLETNRIYHLLESTNLLEWADLATTNPVSSSFQWTDSRPAVPGRFYKLRIGP